MGRGVKSCCQIIYDLDRVYMGERKKESVCVTWRESVCERENGIEGGREGEREWVCVYMWAGMIPSVLYRAAVCRSALQCTAVFALCCSVLQARFRVCCTGFHCVVVHCSVLTVYYSVLQCVECVAEGCSSAIRHDSE